VVSGTTHQGSIGSHFRSVNPFTSREALRTSAYLDDAKLMARQAIYRFLERPGPSSHDRVREVVDLRGDETVVDIGCGNGNDLRQLRAGGHAGPLLAFDLSAGMLRTLDADVPAVNADAAALPLRDDTADVALAMHMLYHCPDIPATAVELRRVVRPGGALVTSTNSVDHLTEIGDALSSAITAAGGRTSRAWGEGPARFSLEQGGEVLAASFTAVERHEVRNRLLVTDADAVVDYVRSVRDLYDEPDAVWDEAMVILGERVAREIHDHGAFAVATATGTFIAR
jgi:SAM-dependent methyltransferase